MDTFQEIKYRSNLWKTFPRSTAMIVGAITLLVTLNPLVAAQACTTIWFVLFLLKLILPSNIAELNMWLYVSIPVQIVGIHPVRRLLFIIALILALVMGAPFTTNFIFLVGLFVLDFIY